MKKYIDFHKITAIRWYVVIELVGNREFFTKMLWYPQLYDYLRGARMRNTLFFYKNAKDLAEPEDVLILAHTFS